MELNNITNTGTWSEQATRLNDNFNKVALGIDTLQSAYQSLSQSAIEVVATLPQTGQANKIYRLVGTTSYTDYMYNADDLTTPILMATYNNAIDNTPTANSANLVTSGGVAEELALGAVYDVSAKNPTAGSNNDGKWESISALLSDANINTLIPFSVRKGGMSVKFVLSSDNKYVQWRLMANAFSTTVTYWQGVDDEPTAGSKNLVESGGAFTKEILFKVSEGDGFNVNINKVLNVAVSGNNGQIYSLSSYDTYVGNVRNLPIIIYSNTSVSLRLYDEKGIFLGKQTYQSNEEITAFPYNNVKYIACDRPHNQLIKAIYSQESTSIEKELPYDNWEGWASINSSGNVIINDHSENYRISKLIKVKAGEEYLLTAANTSTSDLVYALYNNSFTFLSGKSASVSDTIKTYYVNVAQDGYLRVASQNNRATLIKIDKDKNLIKRTISYNEFCINGVVSGGVFINSTGTIVTHAFSYLHISKPIYVKNINYINLLLQSPGGNDIVVAFYDANNDYLSGLKSSDAGYRYIQVPNNAVFAHFASAKEGTYIVLNTELPSLDRNEVQIIERCPPGNFYFSENAWDGSTIFKVKSGDAISVETEAQIDGRIYYYTKGVKDYNREKLSEAALPAASSLNIVPDGAEYASVLLPHSDGNNKKSIKIWCTSDVYRNDIYKDGYNKVFLCRDYVNSENIGYYNKNSNTIITTYSEFRYTELIEVSVGEIYYLQLLDDGANSLVVFYNEDQEVIRGLNVINLCNSNIAKVQKGFIIPEGVKYIRCFFGIKCGYTDGLYRGTYNKQNICNKQQYVNGLIVNSLKDAIIPSDALLYYDKNDDGSIYCKNIDEASITFEDWAHLPVFGDNQPCCDRFTIQYRVIFDAASTLNFALIKGGGFAVSYSLIKDTNGSRFEIKGARRNSASYVTTINIDEEIVSQKEYFIEIRKETRATPYYFIRISSDDRLILEWNGAVTDKTAALGGVSCLLVGWGVPYFAAKGGCNATIKDLVWKMGYFEAPTILVIGHSLGEFNAMAGNRDKTFLSLLSEHLGGGKVINCCQGGARWSTYQYMLDFYLSRYPTVKYLFCINGQNDRDSGVLTRTQQQYARMIAIANCYDVEVIGTTLCPEVGNIESGVWEDYQEPTNDWIRSQQLFRYVDIMKAITDANGDRIPDLYITPTDSHPNTEGNKRIYIQCLKDIPDWNI